MDRAQFAAMVDQYRALAQTCTSVDCAKAHADRYQTQYDEHREYLDEVVLAVVKVFREREEELSGEDCCDDRRLRG